MSRLLKLKTLFLVINTQCNLSCAYCYYKLFPRKKSFIQITPEVIKKFFDLKGCIKNVSITGGEPLLNEDLLSYMEIARNIGAEVTISTNAILINQNLIDQLKQQGVNKIKMFISLDSLNPSYTLRGGKSKKIIQAIKMCIKNGFKVNICSVISTENIDEIFSLQSFCDRYNLKFWPQPVYIPNNKDLQYLSLKNIKDADWRKMIDCIPKKMERSPAANFIKKYYKMIIKNDFARDKACPFERESMIINIDGNILTCFYRKDSVIGNINNDVVLSEVLRRRRHKIRSLNCSGEQCFSLIA